MRSSRHSTPDIGGASLLLMAALWRNGAAMSELTPRLARLKFRAWHRGTREADYMIGCFFDRFHAEWTEDDIVWFEDLIDEDDVDIMAWALGVQIAPDRYLGALMDKMKSLDYVHIPR